MSALDPLDPLDPFHDPFEPYNAIEASTAWGSPNDQAVWPWWAFVKETWIPRPANLTIEAAPEYELEQRKQLVKEWMDADQAFRDAYVARTSPLSLLEAETLRQGLYTKGGHESDNPHYLPSKYPLILAAASPSNTTAWARIVFLTRYDSMGTCWEEPAPHYTPGIEMPIDPASFPTTYLPIHCPNFDLLGLDPQGRPYLYRQLYQFVDAQGLKEGSKVVVEYASNGAIARSRRLAAYFGKEDENKVCSMGHGWLDVVEEHEWDPESDAIDVSGWGIVGLVLSAMVAAGLNPENEEYEIRSALERWAPELLQ